MRAFERGELAGVSLTWRNGPFQVAAGEAFRMPICVANGSALTLGEHRYFHPHPLYLGYRWFEASGAPVPPDNYVTQIWRAIAPGQHRIVNVRIIAPRAPGRYVLLVMLRLGDIRWYDGQSEVRPVALEIEVRDDLGTLPYPISYYEESVYSQNGEDGILRELFLRVGFTNRFVVDFGADDGIECNAAYWLHQYRWDGLLIEAAADKFALLAHNYRTYAGVRVANEFVTVDNIAAIFRRENVPVEFDLLSIDIDGNDYWVWEALAEYRPRVVVIEYNPTFVPPQLWVMAYDPDHVFERAHPNYHSASLESLALLGGRLGYALLGTDSNEVNAFFVRDDLLELSRFPGLSAAQAYRRGPRPPGWEPNYEGPYVEQ